MLLLCENERKTNEPRRDDDTSFHFCVSQSSFPFMGEGHIIRFALSRSRQSSFAVVMLRCQGCVTFFGCVNKEGKGSPRRRTCLFPKGVSASCCNGCAQERNCDRSSLALAAAASITSQLTAPAALALVSHSAYLCVFVRASLSRLLFVSAWLFVSVTTVNVNVAASYVGD